MTGKKFNKQHSLIGSAAVGLGIGMLIEVMGALLCAFLVNRKRCRRQVWAFWQSWCMS